MKIRQWLGYNEDASQYLLRPGELRILNNLQARRPGMLISRRGLRKIYGRYDGESIFGLYRRATLIGNPSDFLWLQKVLVDRELTVEQLAARESPVEYVWMVRRVEGNQSRVIDTLPILPEDESSPISNMCVAEDRHGRIFIFYGHGVRPRLYRPASLTNVAISLGLDAPLIAPSVTPQGSGFFLESVDVAFGGGAYYEPPALTLTGGSPDRPAKLKALVQAGNVVSVDVIDGGANYASAPQIQAAIDKVGSGFRARGNITTTARVITGFDETKAGVVTGTAATDTQTYGATNGTSDNSILYFAPSSSVTKRIVSGSGSAFVVSSTDGIAIGDTVTVYPSASPFSGSTPVTVTLVNATTRTVNVSLAGFSPVAGVMYEATFRRPASIAQAPAQYDPDRRRFVSQIPLSSSSATGNGALATLEFSPAPLGFSLNQADASSITVTNKNWMTYRNSNKQLVPFLYDEFWSGSDFDKKDSKENAEYGGLQASNSSRVRGFSGSVNSRRADVYWPDYSKISVWFCTGTYSNDENQWQRADVAVEIETDPTTSLSSKVLRFRLRPTQQARTVQDIGGASASTNYSGSGALPGAVEPEVKLTLRECPESWVVSGDQCLPTKQKEEQGSRIAWWSPSSAVPRPIVDIRPAGAAIDSSLVTITDPGSGWQKNSVFAFRIYQANAYDQDVDYNTSTAGNVRNGKHDAAVTPVAKRRNVRDRYVEFKFSANAPDVFAPHGPPQTLITPAQVTTPGEGYPAAAAGTVRLARRAIDEAVASAVDGPVITWTATTLDTMSSASAGHVSSITVLSKGSNYFAPPTISVRGGGTGYGLSVQPSIENGRIESVQIIDPGVSYTEPPELYTTSRAAQLTAVMRPALRGKYRCAFRFVDRSEAVVRTDAATIGATATSLILPDTSDLKPDMVIEGPGIPHNTRIKSINGTLVELSHEILLASPVQVLWSTRPGVLASERPTSPVSLLASGETLPFFNGSPANENVKFSENGNYAMYIGADGNLALFPEPSAGQPPVFQTLPLGAGAVLRMNENGNLQIVSPSGQTLWSTGTRGNPGAVLGVLNSGALAIFSAPNAGLSQGDEIAVTIRDLTKPISYSDLSPIKDIDAGPNESRPHSSRLEWSLTGVRPPARADMVELWRTSADQSLVFYRIDAYGVPTESGVEIIGGDTLTDEELFNPGRANYAAMPVVLPNGSVNAYRFGTPRSDLSVAVAFQDRLWMGVSTSGKDANTLYYSEFDEFESVPDVNELPIQNNQKNTDILTTLVPFGSMLLAMQHSHTYAVSYNTDPAVDASIQMMAHRGCLHQRAWDIHENILYAADESGIYAMNRGGEVQDISLPVRDYFVSELLDFGKRDTFFLQVDPRTHILRLFCALKSHRVDTPSIALCYDIQAKTWWSESYPTSITAACTGRPSDTRISTVLLGGVDGHLYEIEGDSDHATESLTDTFVTQGGSGYREAPLITVPNCPGAAVQGVVSEGRLVDVVIQHSGWSARRGIGLLAEDGVPLATHDGEELQGVEYDAIKLDIGAPDPGGVQAVAYANFAVTPSVRRSSTVSLGEDYVRLNRRRIVVAEPEADVLLHTEGGGDLLTEASLLIQLETPPVEIGMEAVGDFIPLNAFVSRIDGPNIHLAHPDGTPVQMLFGAARLYDAPPGQTWIEAQGNTTLAKDSAGFIYANGQPVRLNGFAIKQDSFISFGGQVAVGAERIRGVNQLVFRLTNGAIQIWTLDDSWNYISNTPNLPPGRPNFLKAELDFRQDFDGDGLVGGAPDATDFGGTQMQVRFYKPYRTHVPFRMTTGFMQLVNEDNARGGDGLADRSVTLVYTPTPSDKEVEIIERFNGRNEMRANLMRRDRGGPGGFVHRQDSASTVLNTSRDASHLGFATGVAKAKFASRVYADMTGEDQHLQVELYGRPEQASPWQRTNFWNANPSIRTPHQFILHSMTVNGVVEDAE